MEKNIFQKAVGHIRYQTYENITNIAAGGAILSGFNAIFSLGLADIQLASLVSIAYLYLACSNNASYTKEGANIRSLYDQFLKNYSQLNKEFGLNNPIEVYTMYKYLLKNGYLSDKKMYLNLPNTVEIEPIYGASILAGSGISRHVATNLTDIYQACGMDAHRLEVSSNIYFIDLKNILNAKYTKDELIEWVQKYSTSKMEERLYEELIKMHLDALQKNLEPVLCAIPNRYGGASNNTITYVQQDGKNYFFDSDRFRIYRQNNDNKYILEDEIDGRVIKKFSTFMWDEKNYSHIIKGLESANSTVSKEAENQLIKSTKNICEKNIDIFEKFYDDNKEIYQGITSNLAKAKKKYISKMVNR